MYLKQRTISVAFVLSLAACAVSAASWVYAQNGGGSGGGGGAGTDVNGNLVMDFENGDMPPAHPFSFKDVRIVKIRRCIDGAHIFTVQRKTDTRSFTVLVPRDLTVKVKSARVGACMSGHSSEHSVWCVLSTAPLAAESSMLLDSVK